MSQCSYKRFGVGAKAAQLTPAQLFFGQLGGVRLKEKFGR